MGEVERARVQVRIYDEELTLLTDGTDEDVMRAADIVNERVKKVMAANPRLPRNRAYLMAAMNLADELSKLEKDYQYLMDVIKHNT